MNYGNEGTLKQQPRLSRSEALQSQQAKLIRRLEDCGEVGEADLRASPDPPRASEQSKRNKDSSNSQQQ